QLALKFVPGPRVDDQANAVCVSHLVTHPTASSCCAVISFHSRPLSGRPVCILLIVRPSRIQDADRATWPIAWPLSRDQRTRGSGTAWRCAVGCSEAGRSN